MDEGQAQRYFTNGLLCCLDKFKTDKIAAILRESIKIATEIYYPVNGDVRYNRVQKDCQKSIINNLIEELREIPFC
jgi:hypothetical protein